MSLPAHDLFGAVRDDRTASSLTRRLMSLLFTTEEMATSSVRGKTKQPLDKQRMESILGLSEVNCTIWYNVRDSITTLVLCTCISLGSPSEVRTYVQPSHSTIYSIHCLIRTKTELCNLPGMCDHI